MANEFPEATARLRATIANAIEEDWELVKDTAGATADRRSVFDLAFRFGWHAAMKYNRAALHPQPEGRKL